MTLIELLRYAFDAVLTPEHRANIRRHLDAGARLLCGKRAVIWCTRDGWM